VDLKQLAAPFAPDAVSWRVGSTNGDKTKGMALAYIDARDVMDRLDDVVGPGNWRDEYTEIGGFFICKLWLRVDGEWVWKCDGAGKTDVEGEKGMVSDSFKRAAVKWGVGRYLYNLDSPWVPIEPRGKSYVIADAGKAILRGVLARGSRPAPSQPKPQEPNPEASKPQAANADAASVPAAPQRKTVDDVPAVAPTRHPVPHKGEFAKPPADTWKTRERAQESAGATKALLESLATIREGVGISKLEVVKTQYAEWQKRLKQVERRLVDADKDKINAAIADLAKAIAEAKVAETFDPETGEVHEAAE